MKVFSWKFFRPKILKIILISRYVDEEGNDYQPPYFPPPQFEQQSGQYQFHQSGSGQDGQFAQGTIMMQEDGQEMLEGNRITVVTVDPESGSITHGTTHANNTLRLWVYS